MIFDSHAHYNDEVFQEDRDALLSQMKEAGIARIVNVSADVKSLDETMDLVRKYDFMYGALGIHPGETSSLTEAHMEQIKRDAAEEKIVAIGEIGLDYYWQEPDHDTQKKWFDRQLDLCEETGLPVIIHSRDACKDTLDILKIRKKITGIVHCYSYTKETAREYLNMGYDFGIGGVVTFKNAEKLKEAVRYIPLEHILLETDAPYLAPVPYRGKRNTSLYLPYVVEEIASIKGISKEEVEEACWNNTNRVFRLTQ